MKYRPLFDPDGCGTLIFVRIRHKPNYALRHEIEELSKHARRVHLKNQDGIVTHRLYIYNPPYLLSFSDPATTSLCLFNCLSSLLLLERTLFLLSVAKT